jgi:hypothetical protein
MSLPAQPFKEIEMDFADRFDALPTIATATSQNKAIAGWRFVSVTNDLRLYFNPHEGMQPRSGFDFCCLEWFGDEGDGNGIASPTARVTTLFEGVAYFDGIRHLYFVGEGEGYVYYARLEDITAALKALRILELEHCWDARAPKAPKREVEP